MKNISSRNYFSSMRVHFMPFVVWVGTIVVIVALFSHRSRRYEILGVAQSSADQIAAACTGRLKEIAVEASDEVKQGEAVYPGAYASDLYPVLHSYQKKGSTQQSYAGARR